MNKIIIVSTTLFFAMMLTTCKKYPEGGFVHQTNKHLFGGLDIGDNKEWDLELFEVNGIDSTNYIFNSSSVVDFKKNFIKFRLIENKSKISLYGYTFIYFLQGSINEKEKAMYIYTPAINSNEVKTQCKIIDNINYCCRNIFTPENNFSDPKWSIKMLTKKKMVISKQLKNSYKIILTH